jgi:RNA ligase (TIGR02306 family)
MRKLASIQRISKIEPIPDADKIELVHVLGWQCVAQKGQFKENELCVYFEIDSFLPVRPEYEFLRASSYRSNELMGEGFKIRTVKLRGQISQGLIIPVPDNMKDLPEDTDVTEQLNVKEWTVPEKESSAGIIIGNRPPFIPKTDETRIQSQVSLLDEFKGLAYYITIKCDGSSHSIGIDEEGKFHLTSHNCELKNEPNTSKFVDYVNANDYENKLRAYMAMHNLKSIVVQGEWCGPGIQSNRLKLNEPHWYIFTVEENGGRKGLDTIENVVAALGGEMVMLVEVGCDLPSKYPTVEALLNKADGKYPSGSNREGIVIRPVIPVYSSKLGTWLSMKVISNKYLLKNDV